MDIQERISERHQKKIEALGRLKAFLLKSGDSPRSSVKGEALVQYALEEVFDLMEALEEFHGQVLEEEQFFQTTTFELVKKLEEISGTIHSSLSEQLEGLAKERQSTEADREKLLKLYRDLWSCVESLSKQTEKNLTEKATAAEEAIKRVGDEVISSMLEQMARQHNQILQPVSELLEGAVQKASVESSLQLNESIETKINQVAKAIFVRTLLAGFVGGGVMTAIFLALFSR